jgi:hypothetical protein
VKWHVGRAVRAEFVQLGIVLALLAVASLRLRRPAFGWVSHGQARYRLLNGMQGVFRTIEAHSGQVVPRGVLLLDLAAIALLVATIALRALRRNGRASRLG